MTIANILTAANISDTQKMILLIEEDLKKSYRAFLKLKNKREKMALMHIISVYASELEELNRKD